MSKPTLDGGIKFYDELYGETPWYPTLAADWFAWDWYATLGIGVRLGYYKASGFTAEDINKPISEITAADVKPNKNAPTSLTALPIKLLIVGQFTPFDRKWLVIDAWAGLESTYWQESRETGVVEVAESSAALKMIQDEDSSDEVLSKTHTGTEQAIVVGFAGNILLNPLDTRSPASMRHSMGLGQVYLSPFAEVVRALNDSGGITWARSSIGLGFTFESVR